MAFYKNLTREQVIDRLTAQDVRYIERCLEEGDYEFLVQVLKGEHFTQYNNMTPDALMDEYLVREDEIAELIEDDSLPYPLDS